MQGKLFETDAADILSAENINWNEKFIHWAKTHMDLCDCYVDEKNDKMRVHLRKRVEHSMHYGHQLLNSIIHESQTQKGRNSIPLSGMNRFSKQQERYATDDGEFKNRKPSKTDHKETSSESRKPCLPSKTYLKKKEN